MPGLIDEIQRDALNPAVAVSTILRKVKVAASKLGLERVEDWVEQELNGYTGKVPDYRVLYGRPQALNPYHGWIPIIMQDDEMNTALSCSHLRQSISTVEDLIDRSTAGFVEMQFPPSVIRSLNQGMDVEFGRMSNHLSVTQIQGVADAVRNLALDWALALEKSGVSGDGYSFDEADRQNAQTSQMTVHIAGNVAGNIGHGNSSGNIRAKQSLNEGDVFKSLSEAVSAAIDDKAEREKLLRQIDEMKQAQTDQPAFAEKYGRFIASAANHMGIVAPFLPALAGFLA